MCRHRGSLSNCKNCHVGFKNNCREIRKQKFIEEGVNKQFFRLWRIFPSSSLNLCLACSTTCLPMWIAFFTEGYRCRNPVKCCFRNQHYTSALGLESSWTSAALHRKCIKWWLFPFMPGNLARGWFPPREVLQWRAWIRDVDWKSFQLQGFLWSQSPVCIGGGGDLLIHFLNAKNYPFVFKTFQKIS